MDSEFSIYYISGFILGFFGRALFFEIGRFFLILGLFEGPVMGPTTRLGETLLYLPIKIKDYFLYEIFI